MSNLPLPDHGKFFDLNVPYDNNAKEKLQMLVKLGYEVVAFNNFVHSTTTTKDKSYIPGPPPQVPINPAVLKTLNKFNTSLMQLSRLTIELKIPDDLLKVKKALSTNMYDIIAVCPLTEEFFRQSCTELNVDIITISNTSLIQYIAHFKCIACARKRGIFIEICYSPMIRDPATCSSTITNAVKLSRVRNCENLILSSGCLNLMELRGPYDVANLNVLTGIQESRFIHTVSKNPRAAVVHAFLRKTAKGAIYVQKLNPSEVQNLVSDEESEVQESKEIEVDDSVQVEGNSENIHSLPDHIKTNTKKNLNKAKNKEKVKSVSSNPNNFEKTVSSPELKGSKLSDDIENVKDASTKLSKSKQSKILKQKKFKKRKSQSSLNENSPGVKRAALQL